MTGRIRITYDIVTPESAEAGDFAESGWIDDEGERMGGVYDAIRFLRDHGATSPSCSDYHPHVWYSDDGETDYVTGEVETRAYHLVGFTASQRERIYRACTHMQNDPKCTTGA